MRCMDLPLDLFVAVFSLPAVCPSRLVNGTAPLSVHERTHACTCK